MAHLQYMPGDPRLVDQLVYELKSKGIFDQFRKECIADVDTRPAYQNLRQRVESSVSLFLSRQTWKPDLNKNQLREKLRKHILDGNYLEQGVERIVDQVVNPKVAAVFMPQVEDLVYNYLGIPRKKTTKAETTEKTTEELIPTELEAVSPGSVKSNDGERKDSQNKVQDMEIDSEGKTETSEDISMDQPKDIIVDESSDSGSLDKSSIPLPTEEIKLENIPAPDNSPKTAKNELENIELPQEMDKPDSDELKNIELPREQNLSTDIPLPDESNASKDSFFRPIVLHSEESNSSSSSSIRRNMSPLTPVRNFDDENSCDAQQAFENDTKENDHKEPSSFSFSIENKQSNDSTDVKEPKETEHLSYQFNNQVNINSYNTPMYDDSSNSHNLQIDYESDANTNTSKTTEIKQFVENSEDSKKERKEEKKSHKSSHRSRDSSRHSSSKDKHSSRDSSRHDKKSSAKDDKSKSSKDRDRSKDRSDKRDSSKNKSSHKSSSSSKDKHRSSSSSHRPSSKSSDEKKSASNNKSSDKDKERSSDKDKSSRDKKDSTSSHRDKDRKSSKKDDKDKKKEKKDTDDHYSSSGRGNHSRRSTDRDSNDGSSSSKGSQSQNNSKSTTESKKESKSNSKSDNISTSGESTSQSDKEHVVQNKISQFKPIVRVDNHLETPIANPPRLPFVPDVTLKKPKFANNFEEAKKMMKMRKFLAEEQKRMNQEAALLLEFQANVRPSLSQVYSSIPGPELEFACVTHNEIVSQQETVDHNQMAPQEETVKPPNDIVSQQETVVTPNKVVSEQKTVVIYNELAPQETIVTHKEIIPQQETVVTQKDIMPQETVVRVVEPVKVEAFDTKVPETNIPMVCSLHEPLEMKEITKDAKDIINDIIGVPVEEYREEHNDLIITELSEVNTTENEVVMDTCVENKHIYVADEINELSQAKRSQDSLEESLAEIVHDDSTDFEITVPVETLSETDVSEILEMSDEKPEYPEKELQYFSEIEKFNAELERHQFSNFLNKFIESTNSKNKIYIVNCDTYEENIVKEIASKFGDYEVVNYFKNGHFVPNKNIVKDVSLTDEISLPLDTNAYEYKSPLFSPVKSECSFELSSDYDAKLDEIVNKKSRQEVMEIILGGVIDEPNKMPTIDYYTELSDIEDPMTAVEHVIETESKDNLKRKVEEELINKSVLTPNKIRKLSGSDQISSTTEEPEVSNNNKVQSVPRSKYLGRAKRVGLSRPKRYNLSNSPSSDKSVENYTQNTATPPNGKLKPTPRSKVQRYDKSDLYKPKLHYLSRRNNIS